jgi:hypothetical protein
VIDNFSPKSMYPSLESLGASGDRATPPDQGLLLEEVFGGASEVTEAKKNPIPSGQNGDYLMLSDFTSNAHGPAAHMMQSFGRVVGSGFAGGSTGPNYRPHLGPGMGESTENEEYENMRSIDDG